MCSGPAGGVGRPATCDAFCPRRTVDGPAPKRCSSHTSTQASAVLPAVLCCLWCCAVVGYPGSGSRRQRLRTGGACQGWLDGVIGAEVTLPTLSVTSLGFGVCACGDSDSQ